MILLIAPHSQSTYGELNEFAAVEPPIWAAMLSKALKVRGHHNLLIDQHAEGKSHRQIAEDIQNLNPQLVVMVIYGHQPSASTQTMQAAHELLEEMGDLGLRKRYSVVLVGGHPSALPWETLENEQYAPLSIAKGEGLNPILRLLGGAHPDHIPGFYHKHDWWINKAKSQDTKAENLDETFPGIDWGNLPMHRYRAHNWHVLERPETINSYASIYTSLGCPFKCSFCCINAPFDSNAFRYWSPTFTVDQIERLSKEFGIQNLKIADEMFVLREDHFMEICRQIIERKIQMNIWAYARVDTVKDRYLETLKAAGINWLALGIESGSQHVRDGVTKGRFKLDDIYRTVGEIQRHGINVIGNYIFGLPDDTEESMAETLEMALGLNCEFANFYSAMAYPGSPLYNLTPKSALPDSYLGYSQHSYDTKPLNTKTVEARRVLQIRDEAHTKYFTSSSYLGMVERKFGQPGLQLIQAMNKKTIRRKLYDVCKASPTLEGDSNQQPSA